MEAIKKGKDICSENDVIPEHLLKYARISSSYRFLDVINQKISKRAKIRKRVFPLSKHSLYDLLTLKDWTDWLTSRNIPWVLTQRRTDEGVIPDHLVLWALEQNHTQH